MRDIWAMQPRFERRTGKAPYKLLEHLRLRAGYDFLLLRCASGEIDAELGDWWTDFMEADSSGRESLLARKPTAGSAAGAAAAGPAGSGTGPAPAARKRKRRGGRNRSKSGGGEGGGNSSSDGDA